jgi:chorismate synthase
MSTFGTLFRVTTYGESHCASVGAIIDGCPPVSRGLYMESSIIVTEKNDLQGLKLSAQDVQTQLSRRRPGQSNLTTPVSSDLCFFYVSLFIFIFDNSATRRTLCTFSQALSTASL